MEYVLDINTWRCGDDGDHHLGNGDTALLNSEGYMCCLGQFAKQKGVPDEILLGRGNPQAIHRYQIAENGIDPAEPYDPAFIGHGDMHLIISDLAFKLTDINDEPSTTYQTKIDLIRKALEEHGHSLKVINGEVNE